MERKHSEEERFFRAMWDWLSAQEPFAFFRSKTSDPVKALDRLAIEHPTRWRSGLREAVSDLVTMTQDFEGNQLSEVEEHLRTLGAPSLTSMRMRKRGFVSKLLKRGRIERDEEYRALISQLEDGNESKLTPEEVQVANRLLAEYEQRLGE